KRSRRRRHRAQIPGGTAPALSASQRDVRRGEPCPFRKEAKRDSIGLCGRETQTKYAQLTSRRGSRMPRKCARAESCLISARQPKGVGAEKENEQQQFHLADVTT